MTSESRLPIAIFLAIVALIAVPIVVDLVRERRRPVLAEARVVTATSSDPVFRNGRRRVADGDRVDVALALRLERLGGTDEWLSPAAALEIDGKQVAHRQTARWPEAGRSLRVFWFSVECSNLGGTLTPDTAGDRLRYRTFLAPEMGRSLMAERLPEQHNDDHIGQSEGPGENGTGTIRLYARVEVVVDAGDVRAQQTAATMEAERFLDRGFPTLLLESGFGAPIDDAVGELFRLPGFETQGPTAAVRNDVTVDAFGKKFTQLVSDRIVVSSWTLAATALNGRPDLDPSQLEDLGRITIGDEIVGSGGRPLAWGVDVLAGDLLSDAGHWFVLVGDNGDGLLDPSDAVLHSWHRPAVRTTLFAAAGSDVRHLEHRRLAR